MSDGHRSIWTTREGVMIIAVCVVVGALALWGIGSWVQDNLNPAPKQPPAKTKPDQKPQPPQPKLPNPDANP
ncbi:MAG TPA: hypothetical protein PKV72_03305 [Candidatus Peribacteria bacterium]|nr:hypothetical protein [Candidatus Peribacteria bacterium]